MIFRSPNRFSDSVRDAQSHDIKILIEFCNCVGSTIMRGCYPMKLCLVAIFNYPVILGCFLV